MLKLLSAALYLSLLCVCMDVAHAAIEYVDVTGGINFATTGNPNGPDLPEWKAFGEHSQDAMVFRYESIQSERIPNADGIRAWDGVLLCRK